MSTYTESLGLELITPGSQAGLWGNTTNNTFNLIDQAITGVTPLSFAGASGSTITLTDSNGAANQARAAVLNITGTAVGSNTVVVPNKTKTYLVRNETTKTVRFQTLSPSAYYDVEAGYSILIFCDGNNNVFTGIASPSVGTLSVNGGGTGNAGPYTAGFVKSPGGTTAFTSAATVSLSTEVSGTLPVANGGTGQTSLTSGALLVGNGTGSVAVLSGGISGYVPTWNGSTWVPAQPPGGVTSVNSQTGPAVVLTASDVGALSTSGTATDSSKLGGVAASGYVATTGTQTIAGAKTFSSGITTTGIAYSSGGGDGPAAKNFYSAITGADYNSIYYEASGTALASQGYVMAFKTPGSNSFSIGQIFNGNGYAYAVSWVSSSDERIKENVTTLSSGLDKIGQLRPVEFSFKRDNLTSPDHYGLIAQEIENVLPNVVSESTISDGDVTNIKGVAYTELIPILIKAVQELKAEVDALKAAK